nr:dynamin family protein [Phascolarctobacterium succinatutens]
MAQVYVKYNPYRLETTLKVNGRDISTDSILYKVTKGKRLQEWIGKFPTMLREELNTVDFALEFCGMALDWDDFEDAFEQAEREGLVKISDLKYIAGKSDDNINERIVAIFQELQDGPIDDFRDPKLLRAFECTNNSIFPVNVIATMSSGKSTLINALLENKLMPSKNEACTATITEILDVDNPHFSAVVYDGDNSMIQEVPELTLEIMGELNDDENVHRISAEGDIPFLDSKSTALMLVDTPGPNNAQNQAHKNTTYRAINSDSNNLILYVLNGTQLSTNDDAALLHYVADQIKKGGKQVRDRFLFVINKMDQFNPEEEDIGKAVLSAKRYLATYGIEDPQIFPCSAFTALNIRTYFEGIDIDNLTRAQERMLPLTARDTLPMIDKFVYYESMHLEEYSTLSPSAQQELNFRLSQAVANNDTKEQALIHSGIYSIEAAITAYVKKYAKTKKVKDLVESFQEVLESSEVLTKAKTRVATDAAAAKACAERAAAVRKKIADGKEAEAFKQKIASLDPMPKIEDKAEQLKQNATTKSSKIFRPYGETITSREEAKRLVNQFSTFSSDAMAELTSELESVINSEIVSTGERLLMEYQDKVSKFDESTSDEQLDFQTVDLIKGALKTMRENAEEWTTDDFATETVDDIGETSYEERTYYEKVGQEAEEIVVGSHEEKIGTKKVKVGSHREKVGSRKVSNPAKRWWKIFTPKYIEEDVFETVDDYKDEDVYKTVLEYKTIMRDVFEEKKETIEKFSVSTALIQQALIAKMRRNLDEGTESALGFAGEQVDRMKGQFSRIFAELDALIAFKYEELEKCATDQDEKEAVLESNKKLLVWIEQKMSEINSILDM